MFKNLFLASIATFSVISFAETAETKYGISVNLEVKFEQDQSAFEQFEKIETLINLEIVGISMSTAMPVWGQLTLEEAQKIKALLEKEGYSVEIIDVIFEDQEDATVLSVAAQEKIAQELNKMLAEMIEQQENK